MRSLLTAALNSTLRVAATGPVAPATAWRRYDRLELWSTWSPQVRRVECAQRVLTPGAVGRVVGPLGVHVDFTILHVDAPARRWTWEARRGPVTVVLEHGIDPVAAGSTAWLVLRGPAPLIAGYAAPAWLALHRLVTLPG